MKDNTPIKLRSAEISLVEENIVQVITTPNYETVIEDIDEIGNAVHDLVGDKNHFLLVIPTIGSTATNEAKEYAAQESFKRTVVAEAIVIPNIAIRMMAVAYMKINRPKQKIKLFNSREKALRWIHLVKLKTKL